MLVLSRRVEQRVIIGGVIEVLVIEVRGDKVRLGIIAPPEVSIDREEIHLHKLAAQARLPQALSQERSVAP